MLSAHVVQLSLPGAKIIQRSDVSVVEQLLDLGV